MPVPRCQTLEPFKHFIKPQKKLLLRTLLKSKLDCVPFAAHPTLRISSSTSSNMQFTSILATIAFITAASAVEVSFYLGKNCHGQNLGKSSVHEVYHNYIAPDNTQSMVISDIGLYSVSV
ncbi:hypothetical protein BDQ17DRAFT_1432609 [Cyathus striatus]|nr:hypothetical protein BDQ17DRAFT_1432609 [Cyathus striatus]